MAREGGDEDRWVGQESATDVFRSSSSSHREKGERKSSKRDRDKDKDKDRKDKEKKSSKHSRDKEKEKAHGSSSSSSRKRERSEERSRERSGNHSKEHAKEERSKERARDGDEHGEDDHKRRRKDDGKDRERSHKTKHRDKERSSRKDDVRDGEKEKHRKSDKHKDRDREKDRGKDRDKDRERDRDRDKEKEKDRDKDRDKGRDKDRDAERDKEKERHRSKVSNGDRDRDRSNGRDGSEHGQRDNGHVVMEVEMADGEEEGELVFEPKKVVEPPPAPRSPPTPPRAQTSPRSASEDASSKVKVEAGSSLSVNASGTSKEAVDASSEPPPPPVEAEAVPPPLDTDEQAEEAARVARIAQRAEERAAERARARAAAAAAERAAAAAAAAKGVSSGPGSRVSKSSADGGVSFTNGKGAGLGKAAGAAGDKAGSGEGTKVVFKTKQQREQDALRRLEEQRRARRAEQDAAAAERGKSERQRQAEEEERRRREREEDRQQARAAREKEKELEVLRNQYLGVKKQKKKIIKPSEKFSKIFQFDWDASEDTSRDTNPLYNQRAQLNASFGRGYLAGIDMREQRKGSAFLTALVEKRQEEQRKAEDADSTLTEQDKLDRERLRAQQMAEVAAISRAEADGLADDPARKGAHWSEKPLSEMGDRDWRIFREDFDIRVKGGKAPLPLRFWEEANLPSSIMDAIRELGYEKPSPIQRQAIPIGMERRDIIGIAETGSGKTAAFGIPMITYILSLEPGMRERVAEQGPLALIMAPTRELAIQIEEECIKFCKYAGLKTVCVVGGQDIETQAFTLRKGVEIIIGTPGRLNDCVEKHYLVLNQCNYVVLDEADRMIDMGFEDQVLAVLDAMGGTLKAENAEEAYMQEMKAKDARSAKDLVRVTAMFSATMPPAVEKMAKKYLRHPAIVQIGDEDTGKNRRIEQRVLWMTEAQKKTKVLELLKNHNKDDRVLVFINTKKNADMLGRQLDQAGFSTGVLHGGKTQDQREENLEMFRDGIYTVLVATDVASRGLDIPDVKEVINYELPNKIETYCHRIGRTGRAGKEGVATSFLTEHDEEIMFSLKEYLQSTESHIPQQLAKHNAAQAPVGARREDGTLINSSRDTIVYK